MDQIMVVSDAVMNEMAGASIEMIQNTENLSAEDDLLNSAANEASEEPASKKRCLQCEHCELQLSNRATYLKHLSRKHPERHLIMCQQRKWYSCNEDHCTVKYRTREELLHHLGTDHNWEIKEVTGKFNDETSFEVFFQRVQRMHKTRFVSRHGKVNGVKRFYCNREGAIRLKYEDRTRRHIRRGSSKIGTFCTAHAIVSYHANGQISIIGSVTHYNHDTEGKYLPLLDSERDFIRYQAQHGKNCKQILETLHGAVGELEADDPLRYVDYKTIRNTLERNKHISAIGCVDPKAMLQKVRSDSDSPIKKLPEQRPVTALTDIVLEHTAAEETQFDIKPTDPNNWGVKKPDGKVRHRVVRVAETCPFEESSGTQCSHFCKLCNCCAHLFKCNCGGATKIGKMCKHIHAVIQFQNKLQTHTITTDGYVVAQEVEEEPCILESFVDQGDTTVSLKDVSTEEGYPVQIGDSGERILIVQQPVGDNANEEGIIFQSFEMIQDQTEQRINTEFLSFLEQATQLVNHLHQVTNPENILQALTTFHQLKTLINTTEPPKVLKN